MAYCVCCVEEELYIFICTNVLSVMFHLTSNNSALSREPSRLLLPLWMMSQPVALSAAAVVAGAVPVATPSITCCHAATFDQSRDPPSTTLLLLLVHGVGT